MEGKKMKCPKCGVFLKYEEREWAEGEQTDEIFICNNKKCDWVDSFI